MGANPTPGAFRRPCSPLETSAKGWFLSVRRPGPPLGGGGRPPQAEPACARQPSSVWSVARRVGPGSKAGATTERNSSFRRYLPIGEVRLVPILRHEFISSELGISSAGAPECRAISRAPRRSGPPMPGPSRDPRGETVGRPAPIRRPATAGARSRAHMSWRRAGAAAG